MGIFDKIEESGWFGFEDGMLGSTNHCVGYYYGWDEDTINKIVSENDLENKVLSEEDWDDDEPYNVFFDKYFSDSGFEIGDDYIEDGLGYSKVIIDNVNRSIRIMVVPTIVDDYGDEKKVFGFDNNGELVRIIDKIELNKLLEVDWSIN
jgi:hypothetical protein